MANTRITQGVIKPNEDYDVRHINATGIITATNLNLTGVLTYEDVTNVDSIGVITARKGIVSSGVVTATAFHGDGSQLTGIDATALKDPAGNVKIQAQASGAVITGVTTFSGAITASGGVVGNVTGNVSGSAGTIDVANGSSNLNYYPVFTDNNGSAKTLSIDSNASLAYNPSTNILTSGTFEGKGTVEVHSYILDSAGDVGNGSNYVNWSMTPGIDWNRCIWAHSGAHRASHDTHYYAGYSFNKGGGNIDQHMSGFGRAQSATNHNQGFGATGTAMESNGSVMTGSKNVGCNFKVFLSTGGNSAPASDVGADHHCWVMFIHD